MKNYKKRFNHSVLTTLAIIPHMLVFKTSMLAVAAAACGLYAVYCYFKLEEDKNEVRRNGKDHE